MSFSSISTFEFRSKILLTGNSNFEVVDDNTCSLRLESFAPAPAEEESKVLCARLMIARH